MNNAVTVREESRAVVITEREHIRKALLERLPDLLPERASVERFVATTMQAIAKQPDLADCDGTSILMAALEAAQLGLEPTGAIGGAWIVGFRTNVGTRQVPQWIKKAQLILDYRGVQHLIREGGGGEVKAVAVYEGDAFHVIEGTRPRIDHEPAFKTTDPTKLLYVYAYPLNNPEKFEVMTKEQVDAIRARSRSSNNGPWVTDFVQQARKTVIKRLANYLSLKPGTRALIQQDSEREFGSDAAAPAEPRARTASVKEALRARLTAGTAQDAPQDGEQGDAGVSTPGESAGQQTGEPDAPAATATEVCGATSDPKLGDVETCVLKPGHAFPDGKVSAHESAGGSKFPQAAAK